MNTVIVIGGGAAGMMAAGTAARAGAQVLLLEKNRVLGKKLMITGKGRCNLTNACDIEEVVACFGPQGKFLYSSLNTLSPMATQKFFTERGLKLVVERGQRVFPVSGRAGDVVRVLENYVKQGKVVVKYNSPVKEILTTADSRQANIPSKLGVMGVRLADYSTVSAYRVILATGGASYPGTGSSGDGYVMAGNLGHTISPIFPALVPLKVKEEWVKTASGLSLRNVRASLFDEDELLGSEFGEMLITHFGISGPIILTLSRLASPRIGSGKTLRLEIDLKPALDHERLDTRLQRDFHKYSRKAIKNGLADLLPRALIPVVIAESMIPQERPIHQITKEERQRLLQVLKGLSLTVTDTLPMSAAIVTAGGVVLDEVDPRTMASRLIGGLYFGGEVLDLAADTGGFNLQAAFSTGYVAGIHAAV